MQELFRMKSFATETVFLSRQRTECVKSLSQAEVLEQFIKAWQSLDFTAWARNRPAIQSAWKTKGQHFSWKKYG
jgi:hypothetical protein